MGKHQKNKNSFPPLEYFATRRHPRPNGGGITKKPKKKNFDGQPRVCIEISSVLYRWLLRKKEPIRTGIDALRVSATRLPKTKWFANENHLVIGMYAVYSHFVDLPAGIDAGDVEAAMSALQTQYLKEEPLATVRRPPKPTPLPGAMDIHVPTWAHGNILKCDGDEGFSVTHMSYVDHNHDSGYDTFVRDIVIYAVPPHKRKMNTWRLTNGGADMNPRLEIWIEEADGGSELRIEFDDPTILDTWEPTINYGLRKLTEYADLDSRAIHDEWNIIDC